MNRLDRQSQRLLAKFDRAMAGFRAAGLERSEAFLIEAGATEDELAEELDRLKAMWAEQLPLIRARVARSLSEPGAPTVTLQ